MSERNIKSSTDTRRNLSKCSNEWNVNRKLSHDERSDEMKYKHLGFKIIIEMSFTFLRFFYPHHLWADWLRSRFLNFIFGRDFFPPLYVSIFVTFLSFIYQCCKSVTIMTIILLLMMKWRNLEAEKKYLKPEID